MGKNEWILRRGYRTVYINLLLGKSRWYRFFYLMLCPLDTIFIPFRKYFIDIINEDGEVRRIWEK